MLGRNLGVIDNHGTVHLGLYMYMNVGLERLGEYREFTAGVVRLSWSDLGSSQHCPIPT
jgi:hypothetical protein